MTAFARYEFGFRKNTHALTLPKWKQVHGVAIAEVTSLDQDCGEVDGLWTRVPKLPVAVITADCVPIFMVNKIVGAAGALHAGWRGTFQNIVSSFFSSLPQELAKNDEWSAVIGPSIRACCYEVSEELIKQFKEAYPEISSEQIEPSPRKLDLIEVNLYQLFAQGVSDVVIHPDCTHCKKDENGDFKYFSYRRGDRQSRQYSVIELEQFSLGDMNRVLTKK